MKKLLFLLPLLAGCAYVTTSTCKQTPDPGDTNRFITVKTKVRAVAFFDAQTVLNKLVVRGDTIKSNEWAPGTYIGSINESASSTNFNDLLGVVVGAAVQGAVKGAKTP